MSRFQTDIGNFGPFKLILLDNAKKDRIIFVKHGWRSHSKYF